MKWLYRSTIIIGALLALTAMALKGRYGGGDEFPDRTSSPLFEASQLEKVADLPTPPGNIAVSASGRVFFTLHPEARPDWSVVEWVNGEMQPWPNRSFQTGDNEARHFQDVLSIRIDRQNRLWALDNGGHGIGQPRLLAFDLDSKEIVHQFDFSSDLAGIGSHLNDFQVSPDGLTVYIAEASFFAKTPALIVYDVTTKTANRLLDTHYSTIAEYFIPQVQGRWMEAFGLVSIRPGVDSIGMTRDGQWLYFSAVTAQWFYRLPTALLRQPDVTDEMLEAALVKVGPKTMSDGITLDDEGRIYISDPEHSAILRMSSDGNMETLFTDDRLRWPDGFSFGPDGWVYVTCSALHQVIGLPASSLADNAPYQIWRFPSGSTAIAGH